MSHDREEDAEAEHLQRLLAALDEGPKYRPLQSRPVARHEPRDEEGKDDEMKQAVRRQIGLVVGIEGIDKPRGHQVGEFGESPRHGHDQGKHEIGAAEHDQPARPDHRPGLE